MYSFLFDPVYTQSFWIRSKIVRGPGTEDLPISHFYHTVINEKFVEMVHLYSKNRNDSLHVEYVDIVPIEEGRERWRLSIKNGCEWIDRVKAEADGISCSEPNLPLGRYSTNETSWAFQVDTLIQKRIDDGKILQHVALLWLYHKTGDGVKLCQITIN